MGQQRVNPATTHHHIGLGPAFQQALQAAAMGIIAPHGYGKARKVKSEPMRGNLKIADNSSLKKRMRAAARKLDR